MGRTHNKVLPKAGLKCVGKAFGFLLNFCTFTEQKFFKTPPSAIPDTLDAIEKNEKCVLIISCHLEYCENTLSITF